MSADTITATSSERRPADSHCQLGADLGVFAWAR